MAEQARLGDCFFSLLQKEGNDMVPARRGGQHENKIMLPLSVLKTPDINKTRKGIHLGFFL